MIHEVARFLWWMSAAALVIPFLDVVHRTLRAPGWVEYAPIRRMLLGVLELGAVAAYIFVAGRWRFLPFHDDAVALAGAILALTGGLFAAWAKMRLGSMFSAHLGVQREHRLVTTGPYAVVRHPIYLGLIDFIIGSSLFWNDVALMALALLFIGFFSVQLRIEERIFERHLGEAWQRYRDATPALFPRLIRLGR